MTENTMTTPYIIHINEPMQTIHLSEELSNLGIRIESNTTELTTLNTISQPQILVKSSNYTVKTIEETSDAISPNFGELRQQEQPCIVQIVYPQDLSLSPAQNIAKRGRRKKKKSEKISEINCTPKEETLVEPPKSTRTRFGRLVKLPKHIEKNFKKIEISTDEQEVQVSDFKRFEEKENSKVEFAELHSKKRVISAQYKCPKCLKAYLGKNKMIQHLKKYPDHGPLSEGYQEFNFEVWNYLFDITQKCTSGQRGVKFCEELSNLLHNVQLLKSALFKTVTDNKNCVHIDKVLGNAIGLSPGKYKFDENELYKDVTVLKLITNSDFFKPNVNNKQSSDSVAPKNKNDSALSAHSENKRLKPDIQPSHENHTFGAIDETHEMPQDNNSVDETTPNQITKNDVDESIYHFTSKTEEVVDSPKTETPSELTNIFPKKVDTDHPMPLASDLLAENLLLHSLPNPRSSVDDLMLTTVDNGSNLLDNSTSSDEVMNVDQFVNERFKKIIEPDIELGTTSLNLDLPSLELFHFHTS